MSASKSGFLVIWSVQLPRVPSWCPSDSWYWTSTAEFNMGASWWDEGTPLLHVVPYSALKEDLRLGLEALERGTTKSDVFQLLQQHATTLDGLLVEPDDDDCACWITGDPQDHVSGLGVKGLYARNLSKLECATKSERKAAAAAEKWIPLMVPEQEVTLEGITVTASIRKLQFLGRTLFLLETKTRTADSLSADSDAAQGDDSHDQATTAMVPGALTTAGPCVYRPGWMRRESRGQRRQSADEAFSLAGTEMVTANLPYRLGKGLADQTPLPMSPSATPSSLNVISNNPKHSGVVNTAGNGCTNKSAEGVIDCHFQSWLVAASQVLLFFCVHLVYFGFRPSQLPAGLKNSGVEPLPPNLQQQR